MIHNLTMKKKCLLIIVIITFLLVLHIDISIVKSDSVVYARVNGANTFLYSSPTFDDNNKLFLLEKTYFVKILNENTTYFKVKYFNVIGYVLSSEIEVVNGIPNKPYPENITFNINSSLNTKIRTSTSMQGEDNVIAILPNSNCELGYIATSYGEESIKNLGPKWYYCFFTYNNNSIVYGYVYAPLTENLTQIIPNTETFQTMEELAEEQVPQIISDKQNIVIIVLLCLPALLIFTLLLLPLNKKNKPNNSSNNKTTRKSNKDYYEID